MASREREDCPAAMFSVIEKGLTERKARFIMPTQNALFQHHADFMRQRSILMIKYYETGSDLWFFLSSAHWMLTKKKLIKKIM